jgi:hypothetical protein
MSELFDRVIDLIFLPKQTDSDKSDKALKIYCPRKGVKPDIQISGTFAANIVHNASLKITNLYVPEPLSNGNGDAGYKWLKARIGYRNSLISTIEGQIWSAYQDKPSPDGVTTFTFFTGWFDVWTTKMISASFKEGTLLKDILNLICATASSDLLTVELDSTLEDSLRSAAPVYVDSTIADFCTKLGRAYNLVIVPEGNKLKVTDARINPDGTGTLHILDYVSEVKETAAGVTITAPFVPTIRPGDYVRLNAKYKSRDISAMFVKLGQDFLVINESFTFGTTGSNNQMILSTVGKQV